MKNGWIKVTERLPDNNGTDVLIITEHGKMHVGRLYSKNYNIDMFNFAFNSSGFRINDEITHWQPLPTPPQE